MSVGRKTPSGHRVWTHPRPQRLSPRSGKQGVRSRISVSIDEIVCIAIDIRDSTRVDTRIGISSALSLALVLVLEFA